MKWNDNTLKVCKSSVMRSHLNNMEHDERDDGGSIQLEKGRVMCDIISERTLSRAAPKFAAHLCTSGALPVHSRVLAEVCVCRAGFLCTTSAPVCGAVFACMEHV